MLIRRRLTVTLVTVHAGACVQATLAPEPTRELGAGTVVYAAAGPSSLDLWTITPGDGTPIRLTRTPRAHEFDPAWSPHGGRVAFARRQPRSTSSDIWVISADGLQLERLTHDRDGPIDRQPAWSPDGSRIVWVRSFPLRSASELWIMDSDGAGKQPLVPGSPYHYDASPDWSPDGRQIAFTSNRVGGSPQIFTVESDGSNLHRLTKGSAMNGNPAWSPDGRRIVFDRLLVGGDVDLWLMGADGSGKRRLTKGPGGEAQPSWSPRGDLLAFNRYPPGGGPTDIFVAPASGSSETPLTQGPTIELAPDWGPGPAHAATYRGHSGPGPPPAAAPPGRPEKPESTPEPPENARSTQVTKDVRLDRFRSHGSDVYALDVSLDGEATVDVALASDGLAARQPATRIAARHDALAAVNGDFALPSGKPLHPFAEDGDLKLSSLKASGNFALSADQTEVYLGQPVLQLTSSRPGGGSWLFDRWNSGTPSFSEIAAYSPPAGQEDRPPKWACAARLLPAGARRWGPDRNGVARDFRVDVVSCRESRLGREGGVVLAARPTSEGALLLSSLRIGERLTLTWSFGWRGVADSIGGFPLLVHDGGVRARPCDGLLCQLHPRTGVGLTSEGHVLFVVVDGRQEDSRGITLLEFARILRDLGAIDALNLDGGGSTTMVVKGSIVNDPSGGFERPTSSVVLILPGKDKGQSIHITKTSR